jgi:hypothetical protein
MANHRCHPNFQAGRSTSPPKGSPIQKNFLGNCKNRYCCSSATGVIVRPRSRFRSWGKQNLDRSQAVAKGSIGKRRNTIQGKLCRRCCDCGILHHPPSWVRAFYLSKQWFLGQPFWQALTTELVTDTGAPIGVPVSGNTQRWRHVHRDVSPTFF